MKFYIREAREYAGLSQKELATLVGVHPSTFNGYEKGNHDPKSDMLAKIADACGVTVDYLLGKSEKPTPVTESGLSDPLDIQLMGFVKQLTPDQKELLLAQIKTLKERQ